MHYVREGIDRAFRIILLPKKDKHRAFSNIYYNKYRAFSNIYYNKYRDLSNIYYTREE